MKNRRRNMKLLIGIPAVIVCILFGCKKRETISLTDLNAASMGEASFTGDAAFSLGEESFSAKEGKMQQEGADGAENAGNGQAGILPENAGNGQEGILPENAGNGQKTILSENTESLQEAGRIVVHICGAVESPGVYELPSGSRIYQAVEAADGFAEEAAEDFLNQAELLKDGVRIYIPTKEEAENALIEENAQDFITGGTEDTGQQLQRAEKSGGPALVNINTATEEELCMLAGIGSAKAKSIIEYRMKNGSFGKIEDIMKVTGIKDAMFQKIKDSITV